MASRKVSLDSVGDWMTEARKKGSVGVVMRVMSTSDAQQLALLRIDGKHYRRGQLEILIFDQSQP